MNSEYTDDLNQAEDDLNQAAIRKELDEYNAKAEAERVAVEKAMDGDTWSPDQRRERELASRPLLSVNQQLLEGASLRSEMIVMQGIGDLLATLTPSAQRRILLWALNRHDDLEEQRTKRTFAQAISDLRTSLPDRRMRAVEEAVDRAKAGEAANPGYPANAIPTVRSNGSGVAPAARFAGSACISTADPLPAPATPTDRPVGHPFA